jgi:hypothetical protein
MLVLAAAILSPRWERTQRVRRETGRPPGAAEPLGAGLRDHWQLVSRKCYIHHFPEFTMYGRVSASDHLRMPLLEPQERPYGTVTACASPPYVDFCPGSLVM